MVRGPKITRPLGRVKATSSISRQRNRPYSVGGTGRRNEQTRPDVGTYMRVKLTAKASPVQK